MSKSIDPFTLAADYDVAKPKEELCLLMKLTKLLVKAIHPSITRDVSGEGVQQALLKLLKEQL
jgi:ATP-dependent Clp protease ATP-binding subunit ClpX